MFRNLYIVLFFLPSFSFNSNAQINLVPNPSFEDTVYCPFGTNQIDACANWLNFGNSPDYFNACNPFGMSVPNSVFGFQYAHTGVAMAGIATYRRPNSPNGPNYREFIGVQLITPLIIGQKYFFSLHVNFAHTQNVAIATDKIGLRMSTMGSDSCCPATINNFALLFADSILSDSVDWIRLTGSFIADSAYNYVTIGNFFDDVNTDTINIGQFPDNGYYYIDDVCLSTDSLYNETWTGLNTTTVTDVLIYPTPFTNKVFISSNKPILKYEVYDLQGRCLTGSIINNVVFIEIEMPDLMQSGIYILYIEYNDHSYLTHKLLFQ